MYTPLQGKILSQMLTALFWWLLEVVMHLSPIWGNLFVVPKKYLFLSSQSIKLKKNNNSTSIVCEHKSEREKNRDREIQRTYFNPASTYYYKMTEKQMLIYSMKIFFISLCDIAFFTCLSLTFIQI